MKDRELWLHENERLNRELYNVEKAVNFHIMGEDILKISNDYQRNRGDLLESTKKKLAGLKTSLHQVQAKVRNDSIRHMPIEIVQTLLETFENRLIIFKNEMRAEFERFEMEEMTLSNDLNENTLACLKNDAYTANSGNDLKKKNSLHSMKKISDRLDSDLEYQAEVGAIDKRLAEIGRYGRWEVQDHDVFMRIWTQIGCNLIEVGSNDSADSQGETENRLTKDTSDDGKINISFTISAAHRSALIRKLCTLLPGKCVEDLEQHLQWFLESSTLLQRKKNALQRWKNSRSIKKTSDQLTQQASLIDEDANDIKHVKYLRRDSPDVKAKILKWRTEKEDRERAKKEEAALKAAQNNSKIALAAKRNQLKRAQVQEWREAEEKKIAKDESEMLNKEREKKSALTHELELRRLMDMEIAKRRHEKREMKSLQMASRQDKLCLLDAKLEWVDDIKRDPDRLLSSTKASHAHKLSSEYLDEADRRRSGLSAHSANIPLSARDLQFKGRACPEWRRGIS